jgi:hypothetical protein
LAACWATAATDRSRMSRSRFDTVAMRRGGIPRLGSDLAFRRDYRCSRVLAGGARAAPRCRSGPRRRDRRRRRWANIYLRSSSGSGPTTPR